MWLLMLLTVCFVLSLAIVQTVVCYRVYLIVSCLPIGYEPTTAARAYYQPPLSDKW